MVITEGDIERMVEACRQLPEPVGNYLVGDYLTNLMATVVDLDQRPPPSTPVVPVGGEEDSDVCTFVDNDAGYVAWLAAHSSGYILNHERSPSTRYLVLHQAGCWTVAPRDGGDTRTWTSAYPKTCAATSAALTDWAETNAGRPPSPCGTCRPTNDVS